jgi:serine/threonine protein kinase
MAAMMIGKYRVESHLGSGTYADVYRAVDTHLDRVVALKVLKPQFVSSADALSRFVQEAKVLANLQHERIAWVWDMGEAEGRNFLAIRFIDGKSLEQVVGEKGQLSWDQALQIVADVAEALDYIHDQGMVHRDLKPGNILLTSNGRAVLTDFGLVKVIEGSFMTDSVSPLGTLAYMAPEVLNGERATPAADQYALACVLIEMLTGKGIFAAPTPEAVITRHFMPLALPETWAEGVPDHIVEILTRAMERDPQKRFDNMLAFVMALRSNGQAGDIVDPPVEQESPKTPPVEQESPKPFPELMKKLVKLVRDFALRKKLAVFFSAVSKALASKWRLVLGIAGALLLVGAVVKFAPSIVSSFPSLGGQDASYYFVSDRQGGQQIFRFSSQDELERTTTGFKDNDPVLSGANLYFTSIRDGKREIYALDSKGNVQRLTLTANLYESWDPEPTLGEWLYFTSNRNGKAEIYRLNFRTQELQQITTTPGKFESWSPEVNAGDLYFTSNRSGKAEIYRLNQDGKSEQMTFTPGSAESWSPAFGNGDLYFTSDRSGKLEIYRLSAQGTTVQMTYSNGKLGSWNPAFVLGSLYFNSDRSGTWDVYLLSTDGESQRLTISSKSRGSWIGDMYTCSSTPKVCSVMAY